MLLLSKALKLYKREDIQEEIIANAQDREVAIKYGERGFGKRPDVLKYPRDIIELAKQGATSFHASEELWKNPQQLDPMLKRKELDDLRAGWDLILDIDFPVWKLSKVIAKLIVMALKEHGVQSISIKFSGNKGFHIGVPFEAFPPEIGNIETRQKFPEAPRKIALYLLDYISRNYVKVDSAEIKFGEFYRIGINELKELTSKDIDSFTYWYCKNCGKKFDKKETVTEITEVRGDDVYFINEKLFKNKFMKTKFKKIECNCSKPEHVRMFNPTSVINVDTLLISSRHLFRMPYSLHEKSLLVSVPFNPEKVLEFTKNNAKPENIKISDFKFLDRKQVKPGEAKQLLIQALDYMWDEAKETPAELREIEIPEHAIPEQFFPPCIKLGLDGLKDGRKRFLFSLLNFLTCVGWTYEQKQEVVKKWNEKNAEPLRETITVTQLRYQKQKQKKMLPPNCQNLMYYVDIGTCKPDNLCRKIKNPVQYSKRKTRYLKK